jgi:ferric-dicitrate binding protein FerR (iron transport regulator)
LRPRNGIRVGILGLIVAAAISPGAAVAADFNAGAATVVGTKGLVEDRCTSTLTRVVRGRVSVRDFGKKTVIVRAGKKYVARAKKK